MGGRCCSEQPRRLPKRPLNRRHVQVTDARSSAAQPSLGPPSSSGMSTPDILRTPRFLKEVPDSPTGAHPAGNRLHPSGRWRPTLPLGTQVHPVRPRPAWMPRTTRHRAAAGRRHTVNPRDGYSLISSSDQDHHIVSARIAAGTVLVAGATGTVGSDVVRQLLGVGIRPPALVRDITASRRRFGEQIDEVSGDLDDPRSIEAALEGVDRLFLLTRQTERQLIQERTLIAAARRTGVSRVVKISVFRADEHSPLQIARQHWHAEQALRDSGLRHTGGSGPCSSCRTCSR